MTHSMLDRSCPDDVRLAGDALQHDRRGHEAGDPVALDGVEKASGVEPLQQQQPIARQQVGGVHEAVVVVERRGHEHELGLGQWPVGLEQGVR
jgi:hypothetical protein